MPRNDAAAPGHVCPGIRIQAIDIVHPPGIGIPPIADMDAHQTVVTVALAAKSSAETPKKVCPETRSSMLNAPAEPLHREVECVLIAALRLSACRTHRDGATRCRPRCAPEAHGRATCT